MNSNGMAGTRRHFLRAVGVGLGAAALGPSLAPRCVAAQGAGSKEPRFDGVTLQVSAEEDAYVIAFKLFEAELQEKFGVKMVYDTTYIDQLYQRDMLEFSGGTASHDLVVLQPAWLADYSRHLEPLEPLARKYGINLGFGDDILPAFRTYMYWDNVLLASPWDCDELVFLYNKTAFARAENRNAFKAKYGYELKPPDTWDQYRDMAEFFANTDWVGDGKKRFGFAEVWRRGMWSYSWWLFRFASYGGMYFDDAMKPLINTPAGRKALENMLAMRKFAPAAILTAPTSEMKAVFANGDAPMAINFSSTTRLVMAPESSKVVGQVGVSVIPGVKHGTEIIRHPSFGGGGFLLGIPKYAKNKDAAFLVLAWLCQPAQALRVSLDFRTAVDPWRRSVLQSTQWYDKWPNHKDYVRQLMAVTEDSARLGIPDLQIPGSDQYRTALGTEISIALAGEKQPQHALDDVARAWEGITDRFGRDAQKAYWSKQNDALKKLGLSYRAELAGGQ